MANCKLQTTNNHCPFSIVNRQLKKALALCFSLCFLSLAACNGSDHGGDRHSITVAGSTSVQPYAELLAEKFMDVHPGYAVNVSGGGTGGGINMVNSGVVELGMASRALKDNNDEKDLWYIKIADDGLAVIIHPDNPVDNLDIEQIRGIYTGDIKSWSELTDFSNVRSRDDRIHVVTREDGSGTRTAFNDMVMKEERISARAIVMGSNGSIRNFITDDKNAIGFISLVQVAPLKGQKQVKAISIDGVEPTDVNIENKTYKLARPFLFIALEEPKGLAKDFVDFILSDEGKAILRGKGLIV